MKIILGDLFLKIEIATIKKISRNTDFRAIITYLTQITLKKHYKVLKRKILSTK